MARSKPSKRTRPTAVERKEIAVARKLAPATHHPAVKAAGKFSELGDQPPLYAISGAVIVAGLGTGDRTMMRAGLRMLAAHALATAIKTVIKRNIDRTRPNLGAEQGKYERGEGRHYEPDYNSFPSGHSASSIAVARAWGREYPDHAAVPLALGSTIAALQVVRGAHYISDTVAGAAVGLTAEAVVNAATRRLLPADA